MGWKLQLWSGMNPGRSVPNPVPLLNIISVPHTGYWSHAAFRPLVRPIKGHNAGNWTCWARDGLLVTRSGFLRLGFWI
jgi:hypothetical protein